MNVVLSQKTELVERRGKGEHECGVHKPESRESGGEDERKKDETDMCNLI